MSLTSDDKNWIKGAIAEGVNEALESVVLPRFDEQDKRFDALEADVAELKTDVAVLKTDVVALKTDVSGLKADVSSIKQELRTVNERLDTLEWKVDALTNDIKEIYDSIYKKPNATLISQGFKKLSDKEKLLIMNAELLKMAKKVGVTLPR